MIILDLGSQEMNEHSLSTSILEYRIKINRGTNSGWPTVATHISLTHSHTHTHTHKHTQIYTHNSALIDKRKYSDFIHGFYICTRHISKYAQFKVIDHMFKK